MDKYLMTPNDVAKECGISINTVQAWCRDKTNDFPSFHRGKHYKIPRPMLNEWLNRMAAERREV